MTRLLNSILLFVLCALIFLIGIVVPPIHAVTRKSIDYDALEKAWEAGDSPHELRSEADNHFDQLNNAPDDATAKLLGPQMVFVTLADHDESLVDLASRWKDMLWNGGVEVTIYDIESHKVLIGLQKGVHIPELRQFLHEQSVVREYTWNRETFQVNQGTQKKSSKSKKRNKKTKRKSIPSKEDL